MIAGKEKAVAVEEDRVTASMTRSGDHHDLTAQRQRQDPLRLLLDRSGPLPHVRAMENAPAAESLLKTGVIGHIVGVRQQHRGYAAPCVDTLHQRSGETR